MLCYSQIITGLAAMMLNHVQSFVTCLS